MDDQLLKLRTKPVHLRVARAAKVIGMPVTEQQCVDALALHLPARSESGVITVTPPAYGFDLSIEEDLIEEVVRVIGYNQLPAHRRRWRPSRPSCRRNARSRFAVRRLLAALGCQETINFSFVEEHWEKELAGNSTRSSC